MHSCLYGDMLTIRILWSQVLKQKKRTMNLGAKTEEQLAAVQKQPFKNKYFLMIVTTKIASEVKISPRVITHFPRGIL